ncbi:hypothetical protein AB1Y20_002946 [Prymnesium parvum]|uniref:Uncharacterized protein n=1 Tax=Prymnesium parvum TaxID=97485 RepID=A0AB34JB06_PRYPA
MGCVSAKGARDEEWEAHMLDDSVELSDASPEDRRRSRMLRIALEDEDDALGNAHSRRRTRGRAGKRWTPNPKCILIYGVFSTRSDDMR